MGSHVQPTAHKTGIAPDWHPARARYQQMMPGVSAIPWKRVSQDKSRRVTMLHTRLCELLSIEFPILSAPMGPDVSGPELVAAVSNAGGLGIIQAQFHPPPLLRQTIRRVRQLTDKPFGVNFLLHFPCDEGVIVCIDERVPVLSFFWGDPAPYIARVHSVGGKVCHQVGSAAAAQEAARAGVDVIIAQGVEAG